MGCTHSIPDYDPSTTRAIIAQNGAATPYAAPLRWKTTRIIRYTKAVGMALVVVELGQRVMLRICQSS